MIFLLLLLLVPFAVAQTANTTLTSDRQIYDPGDKINLTFNYTNTGLNTVTTKYIHMQLKKFGITAIEQTRDQKKTIMPEQIESGIHIITLPFFAPPGKYEIAGQFELENGTLIGEQKIIVNATESKLFKIIKWTAIAVTALIIILIIIAVIKSVKKRKKTEDTLPVSETKKDELTEKTQKAVEENAEEQKREEELARAKEYLSLGIKKEMATYKGAQEKTVNEEAKKEKLQNNKIPQEQKTVQINKEETDDETPLPAEQEIEGKYKDEL